MTPSPQPVRLTFLFVGIYVNRAYIAISSATLVSSKRSASVAGMEASSGTSSNKRKRVQKNTAKKATETLTVQNGIYATEKFSDSFSISHVVAHENGISIILIKINPKNIPLTKPTGLENSREPQDQIPQVIPSSPQQNLGMGNNYQNRHAA